MPIARAPLAAAVAAAAIAAAAVVARAWVSGTAEAAAADAARAAGDAAGERVHLGRALRWRLPGAPWARRAARRLREAALSAERRGEADAAREAWELLRGGLLGTRAIAPPRPDLLDEAERRLATLQAAADPRAGRMPRDALVAWHLSRLRARPGAAPGGSALALAGAAAWAAGGWIWPRRRAAAAVLLAAGGAAFVAGVLMA